MKWPLLVLLLASILIFSFGSVSHSGYYTTQLTNNPYDDWFPLINDKGLVVWPREDGVHSQTLLYDGSSNTPISSNSYDDYDPQINNNGYVVWQGCDGANCYQGDGDWEIFLYDGTYTTQLTSNAYDDHDPQINNNG